MRRRRTFATAGLILAGLIVASTRDTPSAQPAAADLVLTNGKIVTVDARDSIAQAIAIAGGRIAAVGSSDAIKPRIGPATQVIDLAGRTATPGLIDTHVHFTEVDALYSVDLGVVDVKNMDDVLKRVAAAVATRKPGEWVRGAGWDEGKLAERRYILASVLDRVARTTPCGWSTRPATTAWRTATRSRWRKSEKTRRTRLPAPSTATPAATRPACSRKRRRDSSTGWCRPTRARSSGRGCSR
jgi:hypothetical protein